MDATFDGLITFEKFVSFYFLTIVFFFFSNLLHQRVALLPSTELSQLAGCCYILELC